MRPSDQPHTVVVGYDGSDAARAALELAERHAGADGFIVIVHAYDLPADFLGAPNFDELLAKRQAHGQSLLESLPLTGDETRRENRYETELIGGPPARAIAYVAQARDADEIIVGARGLGPVRALLGSVSHELLHIADRPVVVIPSTALHRLHPNRNGHRKHTAPTAAGH
jgi:nucleotide-binding universal stress UspA family protein